MNSHSIHAFHIWMHNNQILNIPTSFKHEWHIKKNTQVTKCSYLMCELLNLNNQMLIVISSDWSPLIKHGYAKH
jgi:hypothetical protein